jgi:hypothetical protein
MNVAVDPTMFLRTAVRAAEREQNTLFAALTDSREPESSVPRRRRRADHRSIVEFLAGFLARHHHPRTAS